MRNSVGRRLGIMAGFALAAALTLAACDSGSGGGGYGAYGGAPSNNGSGSNVAVNLKCDSGAAVCTKQVALNGKATAVLATTGGMTLYYFMADTATSSACSGSCAQTWPALTATSSSVTGTGLSGTLATLNDANGQQVTYNGHPLYTYSGDHAQTDANGNGIANKWYAASPTLAAGSNSKGGGYGY